MIQSIVFNNSSNVPKTLISVAYGSESLWQREQLESFSTVFYTWVRWTCVNFHYEGVGKWVFIMKYKWIWNRWLDGFTYVLGYKLPGKVSSTLFSLFQFHKHLFVHIGSNASYSDPLLEVSYPCNGFSHREYNCIDIKYM